MIPPLRIKVSNHVWFEEVTCRCWTRGSAFCTGGVVDAKILSLFEEIRNSVSFFNATNTPIYITSGYRCTNWNRLQPGASPHSLHTVGRALDMATPKGVTLSQFADICFSHVKECGGVLVYDWGCHIDLGPRRFLDQR